MSKNSHGLLMQVIEGVRGKPGWEFRLDDDEEEGLRLVISDMDCVDAYNPGKSFPISHYFPVPTATYNERAWRRWIFECCRQVENHELGEWVRWGDERPFAPLHGPGENPYYVCEYRPDEDRRTTQTGAMREVGLRCPSCGRTGGHVVNCPERVTPLDPKGDGSYKGPDGA